MKYISAKDSRDCDTKLDTIGFDSIVYSTLDTINLDSLKKDAAVERVTLLRWFSLIEYGTPFYF